jgi:hypothetical protein
MLTKIRSFDLNFLAVTIGSLAMSGFAEGDALTIAFTGDDFEVVQGSDGEVLFIRKHNSVADLTLRLAQGNPLIDQVRILHQLSLDAGGLTWDFLAQNLKGSDRAVGQLMIKKFPDHKWADSNQPVEITGSLVVSDFSGGQGFPLL